MKTIVTGAYGFIGSHLCTKLEQLGHTVIKVGKYDVLKYTTRDVVDVIYNCADISPRSNCTAVNAFLTNLHFASELLDYWKLTQPQAKLISFDSPWSYPDIYTIPLTEENYWDGAMHHTAENYGIVKKTIYVGIKFLTKELGLDGSVLTLGNVYGPRQTGNRTVEHIIRTMRTSPLFNLINPSNQRNFVYIDDQIDAIIAASHVTVRHLNIAHAPKSFKQIASIVSTLLNYKGETYENVDERNNKYQLLDSSLANDVYDIWRDIKIHSLEEGLQKTVEWYNE